MELITFVFAGWLIIDTHTIDNDKHNYLLREPKKNVLIAASTEKPLSYDEGAWIKLKIKVECNVVRDPYIGTSGVYHFDSISYVCNGEDVEELKCTEENSMVVGGVRYC